MINHEDDDDCCVALSYGFVCDVKLKYTVDLWNPVMYKSHQVDKFLIRDLMLDFFVSTDGESKRERKKMKPRLIIIKDDF